MNRKVWAAIGAAVLAIVLLVGMLTALHGPISGGVTNQAASTSMYEDAPHTSGDRGGFVLGVRNDAATALAADGDYLPLTMDSDGKLHIADVTVSDITTGTVSVAQIENALPAGTNNIGDVDVLTIAAGETHAMEVGYAMDWFTTTLSLDTSAYAQHDVLAATQTLTAALRENGGRGTIMSVTLVDKDDNGRDIDVYFFRDDVTFGTENSAISISDADAASRQCAVHILSSDYDDFIGSQVAQIDNIGCVVEGATGSDDLHITAAYRDATGDTYTAAGIVVGIGIQNH